MNFVVLSSSNGTTFQATLDTIKDGSLTATCLGLITDNENRGCIIKAQAANIPVIVVKKQLNETREQYDHRLDEAIQSLGSVDIVALMGWMRIVSPWFTEQWPQKILNVHPALLPAYGGKGMYGMRVHEAVLAHGEEESGMTIHFVDAGVDTGPIFVQKKCSIEPEETPESLKKKIQNLEKEWYPKALQMIADEQHEL